MRPGDPPRFTAVSGLMHAAAQVKKPALDQRAKNRIVVGDQIFLFIWWDTDTS